jgi:hypothetical protein
MGRGRRLPRLGIGAQRTAFEKSYLSTLILRERRSSDGATPAQERSDRRRRDGAVDLVGSGLANVDTTRQRFPRFSRRRLGIRRLGLDEFTHLLNRLIGLLHNVARSKFGLPLAD